MDGKPAFVYYISPTQVNVLTPLDPATGRVTVQLTSSGATAAPMTSQLQTYSPEFLFLTRSLRRGHAFERELPRPHDLVSRCDHSGHSGRNRGSVRQRIRTASPAIVNGSVTQSGTLPFLPVITIGGINATVQFAGVISPGLINSTLSSRPMRPAATTRWWRPITDLALR